MSEDKRERIEAAVGAKTCPFCGSDIVYAQAYLHPCGHIRYRIVCAECMGNMDTGTFQEKWPAIEAWNNRDERTCTYDSAEDYSLVCSACGWNRRGALIIPNYCPHCGARVENANEDELAATHHRFQEVGE